jgi:signal transduction histidine kinase
MAAELHDTLEQGLTGTALQLQAAQLAFPNDPAQSQEHLDVARELLVRSRKDLRQSLWQLRSETGRPTDLVGELRDIACKMTLGTRVHIEVCAAGATDQVSELVANHALRIGQEALTNALKHGRAKSIRVEVQCVEYILMLRVADDGAGFDIQTVAGAESGHFGIQGMVQRAKQLAGSLTIQSVKGHGTTIILRAPLDGRAVRPPVSGAST